VSKREGKRPLGRFKGGLEDNIKTDYKDIRLESVNWVCRTQDRDNWRATVDRVMELRVAQSTENFLVRWGTIDFSKGLHYGISRSVSQLVSHSTSQSVNQSVT
jgi:hypothetical protein